MTTVIERITSDSFLAFVNKCKSIVSEKEDKIEKVYGGVGHSAFLKTSRVESNFVFWYNKACYAEIGRDSPDNYFCVVLKKQSFLPLYEEILRLKDFEYFPWLGCLRDSQFAYRITNRNVLFAFKFGEKDSNCVVTLALMWNFLNLQRSWVEYDYRGSLEKWKILREYFPKAPLVPLLALHNSIIKVDKNESYTYKLSDSGHNWLGADCGVDTKLFEMKPGSDFREIALSNLKNYGFVKFESKVFLNGYPSAIWKNQKYTGCKTRFSEDTVRILCRLGIGNPKVLARLPVPTSSTILGNRYAKPTLVKEKSTEKVSKEEALGLARYLFNLMDPDNSFKVEEWM